MGQTICIDIGHGKDTYPPSKGINGWAEWTFNNAVGKMAAALARHNGFTVFFTQQPDSNDLSLGQRVADVNKSDSVLGISIHANANGSTAAGGHWAFYQQGRADAKRLADIMTATANSILPNNKHPQSPTACRDGSWANFHMTKHTKAPFCLFEFAFFTNPAELLLLKSTAYQQQCAEVIVRSACTYLGKEYTQLPKATTAPVKTVGAAANWKATGLQELHAAGIVNDLPEWLLKLDEPAPTWLVFELMNRIRKTVNK